MANNNYFFSYCNASLFEDHLGNVWMVLTEEVRQDIYPAATLEGNIDNTSDAVYVEKAYYAINAQNIVDKSSASGITDYPNNNGNPPVNNNPNSNTTANSEKLYKLTGTSAGCHRPRNFTRLAVDNTAVKAPFYFF